MAEYGFFWRSNVTIDITMTYSILIPKDWKSDINFRILYYTKGLTLMQISSRFTIALHIFTCVEVFKDEYRITSDFLAGSINTNPVIVRKILMQLKK